MGSLRLQIGEQNQKWPTIWRIGYVTPFVWGPSTALAGDKVSTGPQVSKITPPVSGVPNKGTKSMLAHNWVDWLHNPYHMGSPQPFRGGQH